MLAGPLDKYDMCMDGRQTRTFLLLASVYNNIYRTWLCVCSTISPRIFSKLSVVFVLEVGRSSKV